jgi:hypothetical protein
LGEQLLGFSDLVLIGIAAHAALKKRDGRVVFKRLLLGAPAEHALRGGELALSLTGRVVLEAGVWPRRICLHGLLLRIALPGYLAFIKWPTAIEVLACGRIKLDVRDVDEDRGAGALDANLSCAGHARGECRATGAYASSRIRSATTKRWRRAAIGTRGPRSSH